MKFSAFFLILAELLLLFTLPVQRWVTSLVAIVALLITFYPRVRNSNIFLGALLLFVTAFSGAESWRMLDPRLSAFSSLPLVLSLSLLLSIIFAAFGTSPKRWLPSWMIGFAIVAAAGLTLFFHAFPPLEAFGALWEVEPRSVWSSDGLLWSIVRPFSLETPILPQIPLFMAATLVLVLASPLSRELPLNARRWILCLRIFLVILGLFAPIKVATLVASSSDPAESAGESIRSAEHAMHRAVAWRQLGWWPKERDTLWLAARGFVEANESEMALPALSRIFRVERTPSARLAFASALYDAGEIFVTFQLFTEDQVTTEDLLACEAVTELETIHLARILHWRGRTAEARAKLRSWIDRVLQDPAALAKERESLEKGWQNSRVTPLGQLLELAGELAVQNDDTERLQSITTRLKRDPYGLVVERYLSGLHAYEAFQPEEAVKNWEKAVQSNPGNRKYIAKLAGLYAWIGEQRIVNQLRQWLVVKGSPSVWRGKQRNKLYFNGDAIWRLELVRGMYEIRLRVSGQAYHDVMPHLTILANGEKVGEGDVSAETDSHLFSVRFQAAEGVNDILVRFGNDEAGSDGDRNLFLHEAMVFPVYYRGVFR